MQKIGIIGAGQLGQMLGHAGQPLGIQCVFLDPSDNPPAASAGPVLQYPFDSAEGLARLAGLTDVITYEFENVPVRAIETLSKQTTVHPPAKALEKAQDRLAEKELFRALGIPLPAFRTVDSVSDLNSAIKVLGLPLVLKTRRLGYDGKGQRIVRDDAGIEAAFGELGGDELIAEQWVPFDREVSAIGARNVRGDTVFYPLTENVHENGILSVSRAPVDDDELSAVGNDLLARLFAELDYVGVLALELFVTGDRLLANEFAPRVHNSGHWTIEGANTSQFENHLRAILDMSLGDTGMRGSAGMLNLIGTLPADPRPFQQTPCHLHGYGKRARPGRKLGHVTVVTKDANDRETVLGRLSKCLNN